MPPLYDFSRPDRERELDGEADGRPGKARAQAILLLAGAAGAAAVPPTAAGFPRPNRELPDAERAVGARRPARGRGGLCAAGRRDDREPAQQHVVAAGAVVPTLQMADAVHAGILHGGHGIATLWFNKHKAFPSGAPPSFGLGFPGLSLAWFYNGRRRGALS